MLCGRDVVWIRCNVDECNVDECNVDECNVDECNVDECNVDECNVNYVFCYLLAFFLPQGSISGWT